MSRVFNVLILCCVFAAIVSAQDAKRLPESKPSDCASCHTGKNPLPRNHPSTDGLGLKDCQTCHVPGGDHSLAGKLPLSHIHQLNGVTCARCHQDVKNPEPVEFKKCLTCHDMEKVSLATSRVKPTNPHNSPHYGQKADCNLCHHQHEKSENYCLQCHKFDFKIP